MTPLLLICKLVSRIFLEGLKGPISSMENYYLLYYLLLTKEARTEWVEYIEQRKGPSKRLTAVSFGATGVEFAKTGSISWKVGRLPRIIRLHSRGRPAVSSVLQHRPSAAFRTSCPR
ncbi:MAG: hypothetical protein HT580_16340 [Dechloromonas sp.]|nr:MAG: hypothetical protein HT580_16340 [Dechloromonas sp.]